MKRLLLEAGFVGLIGLIVAFAANAFSPHGLNLTRNYFPDETGEKIKPVQIHTASGTNQSTVAPAPSLAERLRAKGLGVVDNAKVLELFHDPRYAQGQVLFIDARNDHEFEEGHIPGAHQFDHFHFEKFLPTIVPLCQAAQQIVVYCGGGDCELSEFAATMLANDLGIPREKLSVYGGGMTEWKQKRLPVETGTAK